MNTTFLTTILVGSLLTGQNATPTWQTSYNKALQESAAVQKPVLVVFGSGADGWSKVVRDAAPSAEVTQMLNSKYVCVYVDTTSAAGRKLADDFGIGNAGMVISDRKAQVQAFHLRGDASNQDMARYLTKYADPNLVVATTETVPTTRVSFYPTQGGVVAPGNSSPYLAPSVIGGGSYCPNCGGGGRRR